MAIPASVTLYVNWANGTLSAGTYTAAAPDVPVSHTYTFANSATIVSSSSPWPAGQELADVTAAYNSNITSTVSSATVPTTTGRMLFEMTPYTSGLGQDQFRIGGANLANARLVFFKGGANLMAVFNFGGQEAEVNLGTYPTSPVAVEVIYDGTNSTANQRFRARTWAIGGSAGSFTNTSSGTSSASSDEFITLRVNPSGDENVLIGRIIVSDDITEDLSAVSEESGTSVAPSYGTAVYAGLAPLVNPQYSRPSADTATVGSWTYVGAASYYGAINESARSDSEYIQSGANPSSDAIIIKLGTVTDPGTDAGLHIQWTAGATGSAGSVTGSIRQGNSPGTEIAAWTHSSLPVGSYTLFDDPLTSAQVANITDFSDLYLKLVAS